MATDNICFLLDSTVKMALYNLLAQAKALQAVRVGTPLRYISRITFYFLYSGFIRNFMVIIFRIL